MKRFPFVLWLLSGCVSSTVPPTVQIGPTDAVVDMGLGDRCEPATLPGWLAVDAAFLERPSTLLLRVRHCPGATLAACGQMAEEDIYPGWYRVSVGADEGTACDDPTESVLRIDLASAPEASDPGLDQVDQRAIRPSATEGIGPQRVPIWVVGDV